MILVTGATGFVGRNLILSLSKKRDNLIGQFRREKKLEETGIEIFDEIIAVASGKKSKSELNGYGDDEFNPWIVGATL